MKINYMSDLHKEFGWLDKSNMPSGEVLIVAGDLTTAHPKHMYSHLPWLGELDFEHVIYICGNHEFYNGNIDDVHKDIKDFINSSLSKNVHFLENSSIEINGLTFHGCTFWTDLNKINPMDKFYIQYGMSDFLAIKGFNVDKWYEYHIKSARYLTENIKKGDIVITHHAPSLQSIDKSNFTDRKLDGAFCSDYDHLIIEKDPGAWIHGHTHKTQNYMIGNTKILCNPRGYIDVESNDNFDINASFEI